MSKVKLKKFDVIVGCSVQVYSCIEVEATSQEKAEEFAEAKLHDVDFTDIDWSNADDLRVVSVEEA